jgi:hypothetical protein
VSENYYSNKPPTINASKTTTNPDTKAALEPISKKKAPESEVKLPPTPLPKLPEETPENDESKTVGDEKCTICFDHKCDIVISPCLHSGLCKGCCISSLKRTKKCPFCRIEVTKCMQVEHIEANSY